MNLIKCKECSLGISKTAKTCPHCGAKNKKPIGIFGGILLALFIIYLIGHISKSANSQTSATTNKGYQKQTIDVAPGSTDAQAATAKLHMRKSVDEVTGTTWFQHKTSPSYLNTRKSISVYFGTSGTKLDHPRIKIQYVSDDWLFIEKYIIKADNISYEISPKYGVIERDNGALSSGEIGIWEWFDASMTYENIEMVLAIIKSEKAVIRFEGRQYYRDYTISQTEKTGLKETLIVWKKMGGVFN